jgi:hypothetical protein
MDHQINTMLLQSQQRFFKDTLIYQAIPLKFQVRRKEEVIHSINMVVAESCASLTIVRMPIEMNFF